MPSGALLGLELGLLGAPHFLHKLSTSHSVRQGEPKNPGPLWSCWEVVTHQKEVWRGSDTQVRMQSWESVGSLPFCLQRYWGVVCRYQLQGPVWFCGLVSPSSCAAGSQTHF